MRGCLIDDACQCAKLLGAGGYSRVVQRICHEFLLRVEFYGRDHRGSPILLPQAYPLPNTMLGSAPARSQSMKTFSFVVFGTLPFWPVAASAQLNVLISGGF